ncbi:hypothetical protein [Sphaerotilus mobilis]|uniref:Toxin CptA n=1 Tax=Sphaerotilus mobilis TaxID=47994 RepID=A0A4Q7LDA9_9BURK|nr:hypothetical protein [Sphaerotilus mobilis]RZS47451.1 hypothetical protein EV685_3656 [Sphaerotilus mobilis]
MRAPTAVQVDFPLGPERRWQRLLSAAFALVVLTQLIWWSAQSGANTPLTTWMAAAALSLLATPALAVAFWRLGQPSAQVLRWTGQTWQLLAPGVAAQVGEVELAIDLGDWLLLRHRSMQGRHTWVPVAAHPSPLGWHALRCALAASRHVRGEDPRDAAA